MASGSNGVGASALSQTTTTQTPKVSKGCWSSISTGTKVWSAIAAIIIVGLAVSAILGTCGYPKAAELTGIVWSSAAALGFVVWCIHTCNQMSQTVARPSREVVYVVEQH